MDWIEVEATIARILSDKREARRWDLASRLAAALVGGAQTAEGAESALAYWQDLYDAMTTAEEKQRQHEAEDAEMERILEEQRRERKEAAKAARAAGQNALVQM